MNQFDMYSDKHEDVTSFPVFKKRYHLQNQIGKGSFGQVYKVVDTMDRNRCLVAKVQEDEDQFKTEVDFLKSIETDFDHTLN